MKLYEGPGGHFAGTQADAKVAFGKQNFTEIDVPTDKYGLISWLNARANAYDDLQPPVAETTPLTANIVERSDYDLALKANHNINVEDEIASADFPTALRLAEHATSRVAEHLKAIADERFPKPQRGYQKTPSAAEMLS